MVLVSWNLVREFQFQSPADFAWLRRYQIFKALVFLKTTFSKFASNFQYKGIGGVSLGFCYPLCALAFVCPHLHDYAYCVRV